MSIRDAFHIQSRACADLGSPFMGRLMALANDRLTDDNPVGAHILNWPGDPRPSADSVPLRFAGALHQQVLSGGAPELARHYPPHEFDADALWQAIEAVCVDRAEAILAAMASPPQTNEIRRSVALIPAFHLVAAKTGLPLRLSELGASAGLNLLNDRFRLVAGDTDYGPEASEIVLSPDWTGPAPALQDFDVTDRRGVDLTPMDLRDDAAALRALSYIWPDQVERIANTRAAIALAQRHPPRVDKGDAIDWLAPRLGTQKDGEAHVVYHTIAWQYFPKAAQERGAELLVAAGAEARPDRPLARIAIEADNAGPGAGLRLTLWPGGETRELARVCFHGRWIRWHDASLS